MQTTAIETVANSLPENKVFLLTPLISKRYIPYTDLERFIVWLITFATNLRCKRKNMKIVGRKMEKEILFSLTIFIKKVLV